MLGTDQYYFNQIAAKGKLKYEMTQKLFQLPTDEMNELSDQYWREFTTYMENVGLKSTEPSTAASVMMDILLLYLENKAISRYIEKTGSHFLRSGLPEVLSPKEGLLTVQGDYMYQLDPDDWPVIIKAIEHFHKVLKRNTVKIDPQKSTK